MSNIDWIPVEVALPKTGQRVLIAIKTKYAGKFTGNYYITTGSHCNDYEITTDDYGWQDYEGDTEYDEEKDCFYVKESWWETNFIEDNQNWEIDSVDGEVTHWAVLPEAPEENRGSVCNGLGYDACESCERVCPYR